MDIIAKIKDFLKVETYQVQAAVNLIDDGNTIPFIARYRKELTGSLNDEQLRDLDEKLKYLRNLEERKAVILSSIEEQGKLTDELRQKLENCEVMVELEDLYRPYKPKKKTRAIIAKEKGLEALSKIIYDQEIKDGVEDFAKSFVNAQLGVENIEDAINGAKDIIAENIADVAAYRAYIRDFAFDTGILVSNVKDKNIDNSGIYEMYYEFEEGLKKLSSHNILAINRAEKEKILTVKIKVDEDRIINYLEKQIIIDNPITTPILKDVIVDSYSRLIWPSIERELRSDLTQIAEDAAIKVFGKNLEQLLMQPPITDKVVLGWDPAFRTGCKLAVVDSTGKVLDTTVIYPTMPQNKVEQSKEILKKLIEKYNISLISLGNGTASRESEKVIAELIKEINKDVQYVIVSEAGASVYSASKLATEEFPEFDVGQRSATSIARRLQDPLAELVKIDPKAIGVGQYQHDMDQKKLSNALGNVVEDSVNKVGVDLNTASAALLSYISGISNTVAKNIVEYRRENGRYKNRKELLKVPKLGPKAFEQSAGFLRITNGDNPLDETAVHPEAYEAVLKLLDYLKIDIEELSKIRQESLKLKKNQDKNKRTIKKEKYKNNKIRVKNTGTNMAMALSLGLKGQNIANKDDFHKIDSDLANKNNDDNSFTLFKISDKEKVADMIGVGIPTLEDILRELEKPSRDPRENMPLPILRSDVLDIKDLKEGMILNGTVRNIVDFGAFVDIGVHQDGLLHISEITDKYIKHPMEVLKLSDVVKVQVISIDMQKKRIGLSMKIKK